MQQDIEITTAPTEPAADAGCCGGACCGGGGSAETTTDAQVFEVEGMTCGHCASAVREELQHLDGVREVRVDVVAGGRSSVTIDADAPLDAERVRAAIVEAGYTLVTA